MFSKSHKHTQTHTHTHTQERVRKNGVSPELWCQSHSWGGAPCFFRRQKWLHQFSPIPWAVTTLLKWDNQWGWQILLSLHMGVSPFPFPSGVLSVHDSGGFFKFSKCICLHFVASCTKTWFDQTHIFLCLTVHQTDHAEQQSLEYLLKLHSFFFTSCNDFT
jgi:hypothetical protein